MLATAQLNIDGIVIEPASPPRVGLNGIFERITPAALRSCTIPPTILSPHSTAHTQHTAHCCVLISAGWISGKTKNLEKENLEKEPSTLAQHITHSTHRSSCAVVVQPYEYCTRMCCDHITGFGLGR
jgi:hypothetical protein